MSNDISSLAYLGNSRKSIERLIGRSMTQDEHRQYDLAINKKRIDIARKKSKTLTGIEQNRVNTGRRKAELHATIRNIGKIPIIKNIERRESCRKDLAAFLMTYSPEGKDPFSPDHVRVIRRIENAIVDGGRFVEAVYRGFGKSTIVRMAAIWAVVYGYRHYIPVIGSNSVQSEDNMDAIKGLLESSAFLDDFPEVCYPVARLEGITQRAHGQLYEDRNGSPVSTHMEWGKDFIVLPLTDGTFDESGEWHDNQAAGCCIRACGIMSSKLRGMNHRRGDGIELRPDLAILDDPQDDESAASPDQCRKRLNIIRKAILKSAGHTSGMAAIMPCTVIHKDDLVDQLLDSKKNPAWQGERIPFVLSWSKRHDDLWMHEYREIRTTYNKDDPDDYLRARLDATSFYERNRADMDDGCVVSWASCFAKGENEISAIQHAYNALIDDGEEVFASEFQNQPFIAPEEEGQITREEIGHRITEYARFEVPTACDKLTAFIDVQGKCLYYVVCGWTANFTGYVIDYGCYPDQSKHSFTLRQVEKTLMDEFHGTGQEGAWRKGFERLCEIIAGREYMRDDGASMRISRLFIDSNDGNAAQTVNDFCRETQWGSIAMPSKGKGVTAGSKPFGDYSKKPGDRVSDYNWRIPTAAGRGAVRYIIYDTNWWKSFTRSRFRVALGDASALSIYGKTRKDDKKIVATHEMFTDHMCSEYSVRTEGRGRTVDEWSIRPSTSDNHWWDCLVGCAVAASEQGCAIASGNGERSVKKKSFSLPKR